MVAHSTIYYIDCMLYYKLPLDVFSPYFPCVSSIGEANTTRIVLFLIGYTFKDELKMEFTTIKFWFSCLQTPVGPSVPFKSAGWMRGTTLVYDSTSLSPRRTWHGIRGVYANSSIVDEEAPVKEKVSYKIEGWFSPIHTTTLFTTSRVTYTAVLRYAITFWHRFFYFYQKKSYTCSINIIKQTKKLPSI